MSIFALWLWRKHLKGAGYDFVDDLGSAHLEDFSICLDGGRGVGVDGQGGGSVFLYLGFVDVLTSLGFRQELE